MFSGQCLTAGPSCTKVLASVAAPHRCRVVSGERCCAKATYADERCSALLLLTRNSWEGEAKCSRYLCSRSRLGVDCCRMGRRANLGCDRRLPAGYFGCGSKSSVFDPPPLPHMLEGFGSRYNVLHSLRDGFCSRAIEGDDESSIRAPQPANSDQGSGCCNPTSIGS